MKTLKNVKNAKMETLCRRLIELEELIKPYKDEIDAIKNEIKERDPNGEYTFETADKTVTSRVANSTRIDNDKVKALPNYNELTKTVSQHIVKINAKGSRK